MIHPDPQRLGELGAEMIDDLIRPGKVRVLGVATGSSPEPIYHALAIRADDSYSDLAVYALDEYLGLPAGDPHTYGETVAREITVPLGLDPARVHVPDGAATDPSVECERYEESIRDSGGIDLQILGIGANGHLGFNEPGTPFSIRTHVAEMALETRQANSRFFGSFEEVPVRSITQGLGTITDARRILLIARGEAKASAVRWMLEGPFSEQCPASVLQMHTDVTVLLDPAAAHRLRTRGSSADGIRTA